MNHCGKRELLDRRFVHQVRPTGVTRTGGTWGSGNSQRESTGGGCRPEIPAPTRQAPSATGQSVDPGPRQPLLTLSGLVSVCVLSGLAVLVPGRVLRRRPLGLPLRVLVAGRRPSVGECSASNSPPWPDRGGRSSETLFSVW